MGLLGALPSFRPLAYWRATFCQGFPEVALCSSAEREPRLWSSSEAVWRLSSCLKDLKPWKGLFILHLFEPGQGTGPFGRGVPRHQFLLQGRGSSAGVPIPPQRRRTHCAPWLGDNSSSSARTVPPPPTVSQPWGGQHGVRWNGFHHCPLGLEDFRKTLHTLLSEVTSEYHGRATL